MSLISYKKLKRFVADRRIPILWIAENFAQIFNFMNMSHADNKWAQAIVEII